LLRFILLWVLLILIAISIVLMLEHVSPTRRWDNAKEDAERDIGNGVIKLLYAGGPPGDAGLPSRPSHWAILLHEKCGITWEYVVPRGDVHVPPAEHAEAYTTEQRGYIRTYNGRMWEELHCRFGSGFFSALWKEAEKLDGQDKKNKPKSTQS
jgi:hypothetical protein